MSELSPKHERFLDEYLLDLNATQAYIRAGYSANGAGPSASALLSNPKIQERLREKFDEARANVEVTPERVLKEYARVAYGDMRSVADWTEEGVYFRPSNDLSDDEAATIKSVKSVTTTDDNGVVRVTREVVQHDKLRALEGLGKYLALFVDRKEITTPGEDGIVIKMRGLPDKSRGDGSAPPPQA